ncbi:hypothetical protein NDS46_30585 (plasmid) [Paenibacillus thiaminolyticus]|uniref:hypothetical protein n=1 Tax=Paenibacillus thiaminolyticus TaxID=49283 RepID=UPI00233074E6|nr:hypothetical protein [Paenibacillus thiaminolyticus]WCF11697.1 hypothetical protein NDS46_30585 [Paenibacillus thiaminolyticus]
MKLVRPIYKEHCRRYRSLIKVNEIFEDLAERRDRWGTIYYSTPEVNKQVNEVEFRHSCGCCSNASLLAYFYKIFHGVKIYSEPYSICIGEKYTLGWGDIANSQWKEELRKHGIPEILDEKIEEYFGSHAPRPYEKDGTIET